MDFFRVRYTIPVIDFCEICRYTPGVVTVIGKKLSLLTSVVLINIRIDKCVQLKYYA